MILSFSTKWGKGMGALWNQPTHFVERVLKSITEHNLDGKLVAQHKKQVSLKLGYKRVSDFELAILNSRPKVHTMREDKKDRWNVGNKIHYTAWNRTKDSVQFAPVGEVLNIQRCKIRHWPNNKQTIEIDDKLYYDGTVMLPDEEKLQALVQNDGFGSVASFFYWFGNDWDGKIIHWTNLKY